jgi:hypothetical protein
MIKQGSVIMKQTLNCSTNCIWFSMASKRLSSLPHYCSQPETQMTGLFPGVKLILIYWWQNFKYYTGWNALGCNTLNKEQKGPLTESWYLPTGNLSLQELKVLCAVVIHRSVLCMLSVHYYCSKRCTQKILNQGLKYGCNLSTSLFNIYI